MIGGTFLGEMKQISNKESAQKMHRKGHRKLFILEILVSIITLFWLSEKFKDFLIISNRFQVFHAFNLLFKEKLKKEHESATCLLCTNMLYFSIAVFLGRSQ